MILPLKLLSVFFQSSLKMLGFFKFVTRDQKNMAICTQKPQTITHLTRNWRKYGHRTKNTTRIENEQNIWRWNKKSNNHLTTDRKILWCNKKYHRRTQNEKCGHVTKIEASPDTNPKIMVTWLYCTKPRKHPLTWIQKVWSPDLTKSPKHRLNRIQKVWPAPVHLSKTLKHPRDKWKVFDCPTACFKERSGHVKYYRYFYKYLTTYIAYRSGVLKSGAHCALLKKHENLK